MEQTECIQLSQDEDQYTCMLCQPLKTDRTSGVPVFYILFGVYKTYMYTFCIIIFFF